MKPAPPRPTQAQLTAAYGRRIPDLIAPRLDVLFCGINPGLYSGATGHHFARPGNRFWRALHAAGFTGTVLAPWDERLLLEVGCGITNLVARSTATAAELEADEYVAGRRRLERKVQRYAPRWVAVVGRQPERIGSAGLWVLPNPSGLNANHQLPELTQAFRALRRAVVRGRGSKRPEPSGS